MIFVAEAPQTVPGPGQQVTQPFTGYGGHLSGSYNGHHDGQPRGMESDNGHPADPASQHHVQTSNNRIKAQLMQHDGQRTADETITTDPTTQHQLTNNRLKTLIQNRQSKSGGPGPGGANGTGHAPEYSPPGSQPKREANFTSK